jgi:hypothetical protein
MRPMADVAVVLPGITGSVLRDSAGRDVWAPTAGATARALVSLGRSLADLELRGENADDGVTAPMMIPDLHLIPGLREIGGYSKLSAVGRTNHSGLQVNVGATAVNSITLGEDLLLGAVHHGSARGGRALPAARRKERGYPRRRTPVPGHHGRVDKIGAAARVRHRAAGVVRRLSAGGIPDLGCR